MLKAVCYGEILWDKFKDQQRAGGAPMNVALHLHKQGVDCKLISSVGDDESGRTLLKILEDKGFPTGLVQIHPVLATGIVEVELDEKQQATYSIVQPVAWDAITPDDQAQQAVSEADVLIYGSLACRQEESRATLLRLLPLARKRVLDLNLRAPYYDTPLLKELVASADILKINEDEWSHLSELYELPLTDVENFVENLSKLTNTPVICVTLGDKGALVLFERIIYRHSGYKVEVADTVGAGDAFLATFINGLLSELPMNEVLQNACAVGAFVASQKGANPDYTLDRIRQSDFYTS
ncbi:MAG: carbohydrate kinase family protein [Arcticibacter sp.]